MGQIQQKPKYRWAHIPKPVMTLILIITMIVLVGCGAEWERAATETTEPNLPEKDSVGVVTDYTPVALSNLAEDPQGYVEQRVIVDGQFGAPVSAQSLTITDPTAAFGDIRFLVVGTNESAIPDVDVFDVGDLPLVQVRGVVGTVTFLFPHRPVWDQIVHVFVATEWVCTPHESDEMLPAWYSIDTVPFDHMWDDSRYWLPQILAGQPLEAQITFAEDNATVRDAQVTPANYQLSTSNTKGTTPI